MSPLATIGKAMVLLGVLLVAFGGLAILVGRLTGAEGRLLPGDIVVRRGNFSFYMPLATCLVLSLLLTLVLYLIMWARR
ncbi:MAG: DUF2905 domain-containing protein [Armatimonadota bacterium]